MYVLCHLAFSFGVQIGTLQIVAPAITERSGKCNNTIFIFWLMNNKLVVALIVFLEREGVCATCVVLHCALAEMFPGFDFDPNVGFIFA